MASVWAPGLPSASTFRLATVGKALAVVTAWHWLSALTMACESPLAEVLLVFRLVISREAGMVRMWHLALR